MVRYEAAVLLGFRLGPKVSDKVIDVLVENLNDVDIKVYNSGASGSKDGPTETATGDARWLAAMALQKIGPRAKRQDVIEALQRLKSSSDIKSRRACHAAVQLKAITGESQD